MNKVLVPVLAVAAIGAGAIAYVEKSRADALAVEAAELRASLVIKEAQIASLQDGADKLAFLKEDNERLKRERDEAKAKSKELASTGEPAAATPAATGEKPAPDVRNILQGFAKQMDDPEVRKTMKANQQQQIERAYDALFKKLNLSEEESKLVAELLADRNFSAMDQGRSLLSGKTDDASLAAVRKEIQATKAESDAKLKGMLGEEKFSELSTFEQTVGDQRALDGFARNFTRKNVPMEPQQKDALAAIMREERLKIPSNEIPDMGGGPGMSILYTEAEVKAQQEQEQAYQTSVLNRAGQAGLSPDQVNVLRESFDQSNQRRAMGRIMGRAFLGGGGGR